MDHFHDKYHFKLSLSNVRFIRLHIIALFTVFCRAAPRLSLVSVLCVISKGRIVKTKTLGLLNFRTIVVI